MLKVAAIGLAGIMVGVGFVGYHPYLTQAQKAGTPFFVPIDEKVERQEPQNLIDLPPPLQLVYSVFAHRITVRTRWRA